MNSETNCPVTTLVQIPRTSLFVGGWVSPRVGLEVVVNEWSYLTEEKIIEQGYKEYGDG
jgi:hypothetical protein